MPRKWRNRIITRCSSNVNVAISVSKTLLQLDLVTSIQRAVQCCHLASPNLKNSHVSPTTFTFLSASIPEKKIRIPYNLNAPRRRKSVAINKKNEHIKEIREFIHGPMYKTITNTICTFRNTARGFSLLVSFDTRTVFLCLITLCVHVVTIFSERHIAFIFRKYVPFVPPSQLSHTSSYLTRSIAVTSVKHDSLFHLNNFPLVTHVLQLTNLRIMFSVCVCVCVCVCVRPSAPPPPNDYANISHDQIAVTFFLE